MVEKALAVPLMRMLHYRCWIKMKISCERDLLGEASVQLGTIEARIKSGFLVPKRRHIKHLDFVLLWFGLRGSLRETVSV